MPLPTQHLNAGANRMYVEHTARGAAQRSVSLEHGTATVEQACVHHGYLHT